MPLETAEVRADGEASPNRQPATTHIDTLLMDLDGTLYPIENGYEDHVRQNIFKFMHERLGVPQDLCKAVWRPLFAQTNQSLKGLRVGGYKFDTDEYWDYIRSGGEAFWKPDAKDLFEGVLGADFMGEFAKPDAEAFQKVLKHVGSQASSTAMFEDSLKNLRQAKAMGLTTVLIQSPTMLEEATYALPSIKGVPDETVDATIAAPTIRELQMHIPQLLKR